VTTDLDSAFHFDVALSYAGEDRKYVDDIADRLRRRGVKVFYDQYEQVTLWGKDLYEHLDYIYQRAARFCVLFASEHYARNVWTNHERKSAQARALRENEAYILPVRLDGTEIPGLRSTVVYVDAQSTTSEHLVSLILQKIQQPSQQVASDAYVPVPITAEQRRQLLAQRPPGWEYMLFTGVLVQGSAAVEPKWRDHQLRYVRRSGPALSDADVSSFIQGALGELAGITGNIERIFDTQAKDRAFGPPGVSGNPVEIEYLGQRVIELYEGLLDWSARVRGMPTPEQFRRALELQAAFVDSPLREMRAFIAQCIAEVGRLPGLLAEESDEPINVVLRITFDIDSHVLSQFNREMKRLTRRS
jgi:hypothetical protein